MFLNSTQRIIGNLTISAIGNTFGAPARKKSFTGRSELDAHAATMVAREKCVILSFTDRSCTVSLYNKDEDKPITGVPIVHTTTDFSQKVGGIISSS